MDQDEVVVRLSHDEALVLFEWLSRTDELTSDFGNLVEDQAEQRALWNLTCLLERVLIEPFSRSTRNWSSRRGPGSETRTADPVGESSGRAISVPLSQASGGQPRPREATATRRPGQ